MSIGASLLGFSKSWNTKQYSTGHSDRRGNPSPGKVNSWASLELFISYERTLLSANILGEGYLYKKRVATAAAVTARKVGTAALPELTAESTFAH